MGIPPQLMEWGIGGLLAFLAVKYLWPTVKTGLDAIAARGAMDVALHSAVTQQLEETKKLHAQLLEANAENMRLKVQLNAFEKRISELIAKVDDLEAALARREGEVNHDRI